MQPLLLEQEDRRLHLVLVCLLLLAKVFLHRLELLQEMYHRRQAKAHLLHLLKMVMRRLQKKKLL